MLVAREYLCGKPKERILGAQDVESLVDAFLVKYDKTGEHDTLRQDRRSFLETLYGILIVYDAQELMNHLLERDSHGVLASWVLGGYENYR
jgi:hypothetical protein